MQSRRVSRPDEPSTERPAEGGQLLWRDGSRRLSVVAPPVVPQFLIRNAGLEEKLNRLVGDRSVIWVSAPAESGKRVSVSAWLDRAMRPSRRIYWLRAAEGLPRSAHVAPALDDFIRIAAGSVSPPAAGSRQSPAGPRREPERGRGTGQPIVVLDLGNHGIAAEDLHQLEDVARRLPGSLVLVLTDGVDGTAPSRESREPDVQAPDLQLPESAVRRAFHVRNADGAFHDLVRLDRGLVGNAAVVAGYFEEVVELHRSRPAAGLRLARARHLAAVARRTMPMAGEPLLALLSVVPTVPDAVARKVVGDPREQAQLRLLAQRNLLEVRDTHGGSVSFAISRDLQEPLRRLAATSYARNADAIHGWAAEALEAQNDFPGAISQFLQARREEAAVRVFADHWDRCLQRQGALRTRMLAMALPAEAVFGSIVATAAIWIVDVVSPGYVPHARHQRDLLAVDEASIAALSTRDRLTVRVARALVYLRRGASAQADDEIRRCAAAAAHLTAREPVRSRGLLFMHRLTRARIDLWRGDLTAASKQYNEIVEQLAVYSSGIFAFLALKGKVLTDALLGDFAIAERTFQRAEPLCFELKLEDSRLGAELLYCAIWLRDNEAGEVGLREVRHAVELSHGTEDIWTHLLSYVDALLLIRKGDWEHAAQALRSLIQSLPTTRQDLPLFDSYLRILLGVALVMLGRPEETLALVEGEADGPSHMPCYSTIRAVALLTRGNPRQALAATDECIRMPHHAAPHIVYTHVARALASRALGHDEVAEREYVTALGLVAFRGIRADLRVIISGYLDELDTRAEEVAPGLVAQARKLMAPGNDVDAGGTLSRQTADCDISAREWETLRLLATGQTLTEIAESLDLSRSGLKSRTRSLYQKLGATSRQEAVEVAIRRGFIRP